MGDATVTIGGAVLQVIQVNETNWNTGFSLSIEAVDHEDIFHESP